MWQFLIPYSVKKEIMGGGKTNKKVLGNIQHKILMKLVIQGRKTSEGIIPYDIMKELQRDAIRMGKIIAGEYDSKDMAGALWLNRKLNDTDWLDSLQEKSWER